MLVRNGFNVIPHIGATEIGEYLPEELVREIEISGNDKLISGFHIYTFNRLKRFKDWLSGISESGSVRRPV